MMIVSVLSSDTRTYNGFSADLFYNISVETIPKLLSWPLSSIIININHYYNVSPFPQKNADGEIYERNDRRIVN